MPSGLPWSLLRDVTGLEGGLLVALLHAAPDAERTGWTLRLEATLLTQVGIQLTDHDYGGRFRAEARHDLPGPLAVGVRLAPLGIGWTADVSKPGRRETDILSVLAWAYAAWDAPKWGVSLGLGGSTVNRRPVGTFATGALLPTLGLRFGDPDGLFLDCEAGVQVWEGGAQPGFVQAELRIPLDLRWTLLVHGLASNSGVLDGQLGARIFFPTDGGGFALRGSIGVGWLVWDPPEHPESVGLATPETSFGGPVASLGFEWQIGGAR